MRLALVVCTLLLLTACYPSPTEPSQASQNLQEVNEKIVSDNKSNTTDRNDNMTDRENQTNNTAVRYENATLAGGCFWCIEAQYLGVEGVEEAVSGYAGGEESTATYDQVSTGQTDHREAVQVVFNPDMITYEEILEKFWTSIDPTDEGGQFADRGFQYTTAIYYHDEEQRRVAQRMKEELENSSKFDEPIVTSIEPFTTFFPAEDKHQNYSEKNKIQYKAYEKGSGRSSYVDETWSDDAPFEDEKSNLSAVERYVTQNDGTEPPFANEYYNHDEPGIYVDVVSGEPLFASVHKYDSGTGWPSFYKPLEEDNIVLKEDNSWWQERTEVRSKHADSHLGHVFQDGPEPTGERWCMNSAALDFVHKDNLSEKGYEEYTSLFNGTQ